MPNKVRSTADPSDWGCDICGRDAAKRSVTRRVFMKNGALALVGTSAIPAFLSRSGLRNGAKLKKRPPRTKGQFLELRSL